MSNMIKDAVIFLDIQQCVERAARDLFEVYGMPIAYEPGGAIDGRSRSVMAIIGYAARGLRGALLLVTSDAFIEALQPEMLAKAPRANRDAIATDVLGEFSNMLVGRLKNQLLRRGVDTMLAIPTTVVGEELELPVPHSGMSAWHRFRGEAGDIFVRLDATFEPDFQLTGEIRGERPIAEGEHVFFDELEAT